MEYETIFIGSTEPIPTPTTEVGTPQATSLGEALPDMPHVGLIALGTIIAGLALRRALF